MIVPGLLPRLVMNNNNNSNSNSYLERLNRTGPKRLHIL